MDRKRTRGEGYEKDMERRRRWRWRGEEKRRRGEKRKATVSGLYLIWLDSEFQIKSRVDLLTEPHH